MTNFDLQDVRMVDVNGRTVQAVVSDFRIVDYVEDEVVETIDMKFIQDREFSINFTITTKQLLSFVKTLLKAHPDEMMKRWQNKLKRRQRYERMMARGRKQ